MSTGNGAAACSTCSVLGGVAADEIDEGGSLAVSRGGGGDGVLDGLGLELWFG